MRLGPNLKFDIAFKDDKFKDDKFKGDANGDVKVGVNNGVEHIFKSVHISEYAQSVLDSHGCSIPLKHTVGPVDPVIELHTNPIAQSI